MMETFKDRLSHILRSKNLTASQFAEMMEIQPSNVSHLLNGRNNPSLDFLVKLKGIFPEYSFDWIIMGKKPITMLDVQETKTAERQLNIDIKDDFNETIPPKINVEEKKETEIETKRSFCVDEVKKIVIIYADNTFESIVPR